MGASEELRALNDRLERELDAAIDRANQLEKALRDVESVLYLGAATDGLSRIVCRDKADRVASALAGVPAEPAAEAQPDEWCPGHGSFSQRRLKSDCTLCRGEYMPEQTVSAGADDLGYGTDPQTGELTLAGAGQVPADTIEVARDVLADIRSHDCCDRGECFYPTLVEMSKAIVAAARTLEEQT